MTFKNLCNYYSDCLKNDNLTVIFSCDKDLGHYCLGFEEKGFHSSFSLQKENYQKFLKYNYGKDCCIGYPCYISEENKIAPLFVLKASFQGQVSVDVNSDAFALNYGAFKEFNIFSEMPSVFVEKIGLLEEFPSSFESNRNSLLPFSSSVEWLDEGIHENKKKGVILNQAILFKSDALLASYSRGLKEELNILSKLSESQLRDTALSKLLEFEPINETKSIDEIYEILPCNVEQEQALENSLKNEISIITGPPGTGKSQIIASFVVNACLNGKSVLIASKNNKAVDVVESRINSLGTRPFVMRQGAGHYLQKLNEYFESVLQSLPEKQDFEDLNQLQSEYKNITEEINLKNNLIEKSIRLRNELDKKEQEICDLRNNRTLYSYVTNRYDIDELQRRKKEFTYIVSALDVTSSFLKRMAYWLSRKSKQKKFSRYLNKLREYSSEMGIDLLEPDFNYDANKISTYKKILNDYNKSVDDCSRLHEYFIELNELTSIQDLPSIYSEIEKLKTERVRLAQKLWNKYILVNYGNRSNSKRQEILNAKASISDAIALGKYSISFEKIIPVKDVTPCWAVTSLSAFGRIPLQPGFFDYVVIDEASQCDIPSALPLLFRAKRAVIVGDPNQLKHISSIKPQVNEVLMKKNNIKEGRFSYLSCSLFDLVSSVKNPFLIRNHYRCHPNIISFSNKYFYDNKLRVATNVSKLNGIDGFCTGVEWDDIQGKAERPKSGSALNKIEAKRVVEILETIIQSGYKGSIGVVSPFRAQINLIQLLISSNKISYDSIFANEIIVDTAHKFQGDEKDVIIFSPVISSGIPDTCLHYLNDQKNIFNVAITRARANLIIVGNLSYCNNCNIDFIKAFSDFVTNPIKENSIFSLSDVGSDLSSPIEKDFGKLLKEVGIKVIPQFLACNYRLDFAIIKRGRKLDIEIDGEMYHKEWNREIVIQDRIRDNILEVNGWTVMRFWSYEVLDSPQTCIDKILLWNKEGEKDS